MAEQDLDHPDIGVLFQQMRRKAVTKRVRSYPPKLAVSGERPRKAAKFLTL
jgi:hypothetical protein